MSLEPGMTSLFARARARGSTQLGLTTAVPREKGGRTAPQNWNPSARKSPRVLSGGGRGTGLDHGEGEFSPVQPRGYGAGLVALSSLALGISVRLQEVPASHRTGFKTASKMGLFWGNSSHFVSFCLIHFYLCRACEARVACHVIWRGHVGPDWFALYSVAPIVRCLDSGRRGRRGFSIFGIKRYHFNPGAISRWIDRKPCANWHLRRVADPDLRSGALRAPRRGGSGSKRGALGRGFELPCQGSVVRGAVGAGLGIREGAGAGRRAGFVSRTRALLKLAFYPLVGARDRQAEA
jgi:hypothetical protein